MAGAVGAGVALLDQHRLHAHPHLQKNEIECLHDIFLEFTFLIKEDPFSMAESRPR
jgi:hypothetical protein